MGNWAIRASYDPAAYMEFLKAADYYLVGYAHAYDHVVVTHERSSNSRKRIKIPEACEGVGVQFTDPYEMLRSQGARFILDRSMSVCPDLC